MSVVENVRNLEYLFINIDNEKLLKDVLDYIKKQNENIGENNKNSCLKCGSNRRVQRYKNVGYFCSKHLHDLYRFDKIINRSPIYYFYEKYIKIDILGEKGVFINSILLDYIDLKLFFYNTWSVSTKYCKSNKIGLLHRNILDVETKDVLVDHINHNPLDNRRCNLRVCNRQENNRNKKILSSNKTNVAGVCWSKSKNKWRAYIMINYKQKHLGYYQLFEDAVNKRLDAEKFYFQEFSPQAIIIKESGENIGI